MIPGMFNSVVESEFFEPEKYMRGADGQLHIEETDIMREKKREISKENLEAGEYEFHIACSDGKFSFALEVHGKDNCIMTAKKTLGKGSSYDESFLIDTGESPGKIIANLTDRKGIFGRKSKFRYTLSCVKPLNRKKKKQKLKARLFVNRKMKWVSLYSNVEYDTLRKRFVDTYGEDKVLQYLDPFGEIATIDDHESLEIFFDENLGKESPPKLFYVQPGENIRFDTSMVSMAGMTPGTPMTIGTPTSSVFSPNTPQSSSQQQARFVTQRMNEVKDESNDEVVEGHWQLGGVIGKGGFATVYLGMNEVSGKLMAVKEMNVQGKEITEAQMLELLNEIQLMKRLNHDNIVRYLGMEKKEDCIYIFVDYIPGGSLESILEEFSLTESLIQGHVRQVLSGLEYLHENNIIHRDIKAGNILLDENGKVYLADFGCSKKMTTDISGQEDRSLYGTPNYMPPEVIQDMNYTNQADVWALGCTIIEMLTRKPPWHDLIREFREPMAFLFHMKKNIHRMDIKLPPKCSPSLRDFLEKCFIKDSKDRYTVSQLQEHPWIVNDIDVTAGRKNIPKQSEEEILKNQLRENQERAAEGQEEESEDEDDDDFEDMSDYSGSDYDSEEGDGEDGEDQEGEDQEGQDGEDQEAEESGDPTPRTPKTPADGKKEDGDGGAVGMNIFDNPPPSAEAQNRPAGTDIFDSAPSTAEAKDEQDKPVVGSSIFDTSPSRENDNEKDEEEVKGEEDKQEESVGVDIFDQFDAPRPEKQTKEEEPKKEVEEVQTKEGDGEEDEDEELKKVKVEEEGEESGKKLTKKKSMFSRFTSKKKNKKKKKKKKKKKIKKKKKKKEKKEKRKTKALTKNSMLSFLKKKAETDKRQSMQTLSMSLLAMAESFDALISSSDDEEEEEQKKKAEEIKKKLQEEQKKKDEEDGISFDDD